MKAIWTTDIDCLCSAEAAARESFMSHGHLEIEHRRPGLWIVASAALLFTVQLGQDRITFDFYYRVAWGSRSAYFKCVHAALEFCKAYAAASKVFPHLIKTRGARC